MIIKVTNWLRGVTGTTIWPFIFTRKPDDKRHINHERIHLAQQLEMGVLFFYPVYFYYQFRRGYRANPFEMESFDNDDNLDYLKHRKLWSWRKYV